jgi:hypothetical protein
MEPMTWTVRMLPEDTHVSVCMRADCEWAFEDADKGSVLDQAVAHEAVCA